MKISFILKENIFYIDIESRKTVLVLFYFSSFKFLFLVIFNE